MFMSEETISAWLSNRAGKVGILTGRFKTQAIQSRNELGNFRTKK